MTLDELELSVPQRFAKMAAQHADRLAIVSRADALTYAELDRLSNQVAWAIVQRKGKASQPVALLLRQGIGPLAAVLGILKAGKFFVRLHGDDPLETLTFKMKDLGKPLLITDAAHEEIAASLAGHTGGLLRLDEIREDTPTEPICVEIGPDQPALIEYTSGSTGRPKGVISSQRTFLHRAYARIQQAHLSVHDRFTHLGAGYFYAALVASLAGATIYDVDLAQMDMGRVSLWLADSEITVLLCSATGFRQFVRSARHRVHHGLTYPHIRLVILTGEPPQPADILAARDLFEPDCLFNNQYGGTECAIVGSYFVNMTTAAHHASLPAGYAPEGKELLLLDELGRRVNPPLGQEAAGAIAVRSCYLASGYWSQPELTQERFLTDPEWGNRRIYLTGDVGRIDRNGCLHYLGREDFQVKIRGYRVEILQIEAALRAIDGIADAAVAARPGPNGDLRLVGYVVTAKDKTAKDKMTVTSLRRLLGHRLPAAMIPAAFVFLDKLPLTPAHKLDRNALPDPGTARPQLETAYVAPSTPLETAVAQIWVEVLGLDRVGIHDNFLDLGGDSLRANQVVTRVATTLEANLPLATLLGASTVADMARAVTLQLLDALPEGDELLAGFETQASRDHADHHDNHN